MRDALVGLARSDGASSSCDRRLVRNAQQSSPGQAVGHFCLLPRITCAGIGVCVRVRGSVQNPHLSQENLLDLLVFHFRVGFVMWTGH